MNNRMEENTAISKDPQVGRLHSLQTTPEWPGMIRSQGWMIKDRKISNPFSRTQQLTAQSFLIWLRSRTCDCVEIPQMVTELKMRVERNLEHNLLLLIYSDYSFQFSTPEA